MARPPNIDYAKYRGALIDSKSKTVNRLGIESEEQFNHRCDCITLNMAPETRGYTESIRQTRKVTNGGDCVTITVEIYAIHRLSDDIA